MVAAGAALAALAFGAAFLGAAFLAGAFLAPAAFLAGVFFLVAVDFVALGAAFFVGVFFLAAVVFLVVACNKSVDLSLVEVLQVHLLMTQPVLLVQLLCRAHQTDRQRLLRWSMMLGQIGKQNNLGDRCNDSKNLSLPS